jgi:hypothetical protein
MTTQPGALFLVVLFAVEMLLIFGVVSFIIWKGLI